MLKKYKDDCSGAWAWSRALLRFREKGDTAAARKALDQAMAANRHVPGYLLAVKKLPPPPPFISLGDDDEAIAYANDAGAAWAAAAGSLDWLATTLAGRGSSFTGLLRDPSPDELGRIDDAVLALLYLSLDGGDRAWKSFDWGALDRLHARGFISKPAGQAKSVALSKDGLERGERLYRQLFVDRPSDRG